MLIGGSLHHFMHFCPAGVGQGSDPVALEVAEPEADALDAFDSDC
jgi:hypothetical protein